MFVFFIFSSRRLLFLCRHGRRIQNLGAVDAVDAVDDGSTPIVGCVDAAAADNIYTACANIDGARDVVNANAVVTVTDDGTNTGAANGPDEEVDTSDPVVTEGNIAVTGHSGDNDTFVDVDVVRATWDNSALGVADVVSVAFDLTEFGYDLCDIYTFRLTCCCQTLIATTTKVQLMTQKHS